MCDLTRWEIMKIWLLWLLIDDIIYLYYSKYIEKNVNFGSSIRIGAFEYILNSNLRTKYNNLN